MVVILSVNIRCPGERGSVKNENVVQFLFYCTIVADFDEDNEQGG